MTESEIKKAWENFNIDYINPCYLCKHPSEMPNRKKNIKCNREECEWLKIWMALQKAEAEIDRLTAIEEAHREQNGELRTAVERLNFENLQMIASIKGLEERAKAEAIKEFAERAEKRICEKVSAPIPSESYIVEKCIEVVYQIAKEMGVEL